jgi:hypothetical protein
MRPTILRELQREEMDADLVQILSPRLFVNPHPADSCESDR